MRLKLYLKLSWKKLNLNLQQLLFNKWAAFMFITGKFLRYFFLLLTLTQVGSQVPLINGYSLNQLILFFVIYNFIDILAQLIYRGVYNFREEVRSGNFDFFLLRPLNILFQSLAWNIDPLDLPLFAFVFVYLIKVLINTPISLILVFVLCVLISLAIMTAIHVFVAGFGLLTMEVDNLIMLFRNFWMMGRVPVDIYGPTASFFLTYIMPVAIIMNLPAKGLLGLLTLSNLLISLLIAFIFLIMSFYFWKISLKQYSSASS